jgi:PUA domain protein
MGAVPHICNGADVMAPGVVEVRGEFERRDLIVIKDEKFYKALAVAQALYNSEETQGRKSGKVAENLHFVGDRLWQAAKGI